MKRYRVSAILHAPVAIKRDRQSERSEAARSISGTIVRGALAGLYLEHMGEPDEVFRRVFLDEDVCRFGPLDPAPRLFPLTAAACKRHGTEHGVVDQLWFRIAQHWLAGRVPADAQSSWGQCRACDADLKPHTGFWQEQDGHIHELERDRHSVATHVGIDRATVTAAESVFYTLEALAPARQGPDLYGWLDAEDEAWNTLQRLLHSEDHMLNMGHHRTRGYGRMRLTIDDATRGSEPTELDSKWDRWSRELIVFLTGPPFGLQDLNPEQDFFFSLSLPTGAILLDDLLRYTLDLAALHDWLPPLPDPSDELGTPDRPARYCPDGGSVRCVAVVTRHERVRGWNAAHGLPRQDEWAVIRGAVYAYWLRGTGPERDRLKQQLSELCRAGLGVRRNEGFGTVEVSDDFHRRFRRQGDHQ